MSSSRPPVKRYVNAIERRLHLPFATRIRVMTDFSTSLTARHEQGESYEQIMASLGSPKEVAAELNSQLHDFCYRKSPWRFLFLALALLGGIALLGWAFSPLFPLNVSTIGGTDGPTVIYVTQSGFAWPKLLCALLFLAAGLFGFLRLGHLKPRSKSK